MRLTKIVFLLLFSIIAGFAQYSYEFTCDDDTIIVDTTFMIFHFRLQNTGAVIDSYEFHCRVIDSVPGWFAGYCAAGSCTTPEFVLDEYLSPGQIDSFITVDVYPSVDSGMEVVNLKVQSIFSPGLEDSFTVYAVYGTPGQYSFDFSCLSDTFIQDTAIVLFQFRIENTGTSPDTYAFDLRFVGDSIPGWIESFFVDGVWANPGTTLKEYMGVWATDTAIYVKVDPVTPPGPVIEELVFLVHSTTDENLRDSVFISVLASGVFEGLLGRAYAEPALLVSPSLFHDRTSIRYQIIDDRSQITDNRKQIRIYNASGRLVKNFVLPAPYSLLHSAVIWDGTDASGAKLPAGVYFVHLEGNNSLLTEKAILLR